MEFERESRLDIGTPAANESSTDSGQSTLVTLHR